MAAGQQLFGHVYQWREVDAYLSRSANPLFSAAARPLQDSGKGKTILLYAAMKKVIGRYVILMQTIGDCVSMGGVKMIDVLKCVEIASGESEKFEAETASEPAYAYSRVEIGKGQLGDDDGSCGAWMVDGFKQGGTLLRKEYDKYDLRTYSGERAKQWGNRGNGVPDELEPTMREHPIRTASLVTSYEELRDAIANGYPGIVCSSQGFTNVRDKDGFARPSGRWDHCMAVTAVDDDPKRPGALVDNSWGADWITGPKRHDQPDGSFWCDADVIDKMLRKNQDSWVSSGYVGYPSRDLEYDWI